MRRGYLGAPLLKSLEQKAVAKPRAAPKSTNSKPTTSKAVTKPKTTKKVLVDHDDNVGDVEGDSEEDISNGKSQAGQTIAARKKKTASETYTKVRILCVGVQASAKLAGSIAFTT